MLYTLLKILANLPPSLKSYLSFRVANKIQSLYFQKSSKKISSNFGIDSKLSLSGEIGAISPFYLYGKPSLYRGERGLLSLASLLMKQKKNFVDIGGNCGYFSLFVHTQCPNKNIFYVEPIPHLIDFMHEALSRNRIDDIKIIPQAIGNISGTVQFYQNLSDDFSSSLNDSFNEKHQTQTIEVIARTFDDLVAENNIDVENAVVKVDVENAEWLFIEGSQQNLSKIKFLLMEVLRPAVQTDFVRTMINTYGFQAYYVNDYDLEYSPQGDFEYQSPEYNWLFCRLHPSELAQYLGAKVQTSADKLTVEIEALSK